MVVPKYVQELMGRACYDTSYTNSKALPGYTIRISKRTEYARIDSLKSECEKLVAWARREHAEAELLDIPSETHYGKQTALVLITDPCMRYLEPYILEEKSERPVKLKTTVCPKCRKAAQVCIEPFSNVYAIRCGCPDTFPPRRKDNGMIQGGFESEDAAWRAWAEQNGIETV